MYQNPKYRHACRLVTNYQLFLCSLIVTDGFRISVVLNNLYIVHMAEVELSISMIAVQWVSAVNV